MLQPQCRAGHFGQDSAFEHCSGCSPRTRGAPVSAPMGNAIAELSIREQVRRMEYELKAVNAPPEIVSAQCRQLERRLRAAIAGAGREEDEERGLAGDGARDFRATGRSGRGDSPEASPSLPGPRSAQAGGPTTCAADDRDLPLWSRAEPPEQERRLRVLAALGVAGGQRCHDCDVSIVRLNAFLRALREVAVVTLGYAQGAEPELLAKVAEILDAVADLDPRLDKMNSAILQVCRGLQ